MATAEGVFPKVGGDPIYASELNRYNPKLIGFKKQPVTNFNASGTNFQEVGSILYPGAGSLQISDYMTISSNVSYHSNVNPTLASQIRMSGTDGLNDFIVGSVNTTTIDYPIHIYNHVLTSGAITASGGNIGSQYWIFFDIRGIESSSITKVGDFLIEGV